MIDPRDAPETLRGNAERIERIEEIERAMIDPESILESPGLAREVLDILPDGVLFVDVSNEGGIRYINDEMQHIFGYHKSELIGRPVEILMPQQYRAQHVQNREQFSKERRMRAMGSGKLFDGRKKDGGIVRVAIRLSPPKVTRFGTIIIAVVREAFDESAAVSIGP